MDWLFDFVYQHVHVAHWIFFGALILAGLNVPISEDAILLISGGLAATIAREHAVALFILPFLGAYLSDYLGYGLGRWMGPKLLSSPKLAKRLGGARLLRVQQFYNRHGIWTLILGRFIPFGVRNCLFIMAGVGSMPLLTFFWADLIPCLISNAVLYTLGYLGAQSNVIHFVLFGLLGLFVIVFIILRVRKKQIANDDTL
jgi:membrane protein DedA with SNARE-associated domain